jgi:hypothetical protein
MSRAGTLLSTAWLATLCFITSLFLLYWNGAPPTYERPLLWIASLAASIALAAILLSVTHGRGRALLLVGGTVLVFFLVFNGVFLLTTSAPSA